MACPGTRHYGKGDTSEHTRETDAVTEELPQAKGRRIPAFPSRQLIQTKKNVPQITWIYNPCLFISSFFPLPPPKKLKNLSSQGRLSMRPS